VTSQRQDAKLEPMVQQVGKREVRLRHLIVARRDAAADDEARVAMKEIVTPAAAEPNASAYRLPLEAVLQIEAVMRRESAEGIGILEPEHPILELAGFVGFECLRTLGALLFEKRFARLLCMKRRVYERTREHHHSRNRPARHRPRTIP
jgi:hypothetical protein